MVFYYIVLSHNGSTLMSHDQQNRYQSLLHYCAQDNHYHIIQEPEIVTWPFWSIEAGHKLVLFLRGEVVKKFCAEEMSVEEFEFHQNELDRIQQEIFQQAYTPKRDKEGSIIVGLVMPRRLLIQEENVAIFWREFWQGENPSMYYVQGDPHVSHMPLYCDFVRRNSKKPEEASAEQWAKLADEPVTRLSLQELGIDLKPAFRNC